MANVVLADGVCRITDALGRSVTPSDSTTVSLKHFKNKLTFVINYNLKI